MSGRLAYPEFAPGSVWLVGAGPGDPGLLTLHAGHALACADIVLHDALVAPEILALAARAAFEPVGKRAGRPGPATTARQRCLRTTLGVAAAAAALIEPGAPTLVVIGPVVGVGEVLAAGQEIAPARLVDPALPQAAGAQGE